MTLSLVERLQLGLNGVFGVLAKKRWSTGRGLFIAFAIPFAELIEEDRECNEEELVYRHGVEQLLAREEITVRSPFQSLLMRLSSDLKSP